MDNNEEKVIYCIYNDKIYDIKINPILNSSEIKQLIHQIINDIEHNPSEVVLKSPSHSKSVISQLDYYFLLANKPDNPYIIEFSMDENEELRNMCKKFETMQTTVSSLERSLLTAVDRVESKSDRLQKIIKNLPATSSTQKFNNTSHLPTLRSVLKDPEQMTPCCPNPTSIIPSPDYLDIVNMGFKSIKYSNEEECQLSKHLKQFTFNNWEYDDFELLYLVRKMYLDLDFIRIFNISLTKFDKWLFEVYCRYNNVAFHNFKHAFMVTQMMYCLIQVGDLQKKFSNLEHLILITASICHDLHHPGYNNSFQINSQSPLASLYNDQSPLENHHLSICLALLDPKKIPDTNIFNSLQQDQLTRIRSGIIKCILATDMSKHNEILAGFKAVSSNFDWSVLSHRELLMMILIKCCDISNEARPLEVASKWIDLLFVEFFQQSDYEKKMGLPVAPFMDRDHVTKPASQCGFIRFVIYPLFDSLANLIPDSREHIVVPLLHQLDYYTQLDNLTNSRPKSRRSIMESISPLAAHHRRSSHQITSSHLRPSIMTRNPYSFTNHNHTVKEHDSESNGNHLTIKNNTTSPSSHLQTIPVEITRKFST